jgi:hypothetical protein
VILVWGFKSYVRLLGIVTLICGHCQNPAAQRLVEQTRKFTLFWIPLFVTKRQSLMTCTFCGTTSVLTKEQAATLVAQIPAGPTADPTAAPAEPSADEHSERPQG